MATCLVGWEGVTDDDGAPLPFSKETAAALLLECPDVWISLRSAAQTIDSFRKDVEKLGES